MHSIAYIPPPLRSTLNQSKQLILLHLGGRRAGVRRAPPGRARAAAVNLHPVLPLLLRALGRLQRRDGALAQLPPHVHLGAPWRRPERDADDVTFGSDSVVGIR